MALSLNEFAQAIDHLRLKLSFEDVKKLFNFIDTNGTGTIGFHEFLMLNEEKWRGLDPVEQLASNMKKRQERMEESDNGSEENQLEQFERMEHEARNHLKIPLRKETNLKNLNINRSNPMLKDALDLNMHSSMRPSHMNKVMQHEYLRNSLEQRINNKRLIKDFRVARDAK